MLKVIAVFSFIIIFIVMIKSHHVAKAVIFSLLQGLTALFAVNFIGGFIGVHIPVNLFSLGTAAIGGVSGSIFLLITEIIILCL